MSFNVFNYSFLTGEHNGQEIIWITFPYNKQLKDELRQRFPAARWSASKKAWYLFDCKSVRIELGLPEKTGSGKAVMLKIHEVNKPALKRMHDLLILKGYSPNTIRTYCNEFAQLLYLLKGNNVDNLSSEKLRSYFLYCATSLKLSENIIHSRLNAIKFYFNQVLGCEKFFFEEIPRPKKKSILPKVMNKSDISKLFAQIENPKHVLMLKLCYGMGLRVSEIVNLKISNIDSGRMMVHIESGKGKKDRYVALPEKILDDLRNYYRTYRPKEYLFEGQYGGQYAIRSVQAVFKNAMKKANIHKPIGIHGLRHSYATHLLECGTDMYFIQKLLGHNNIKTTEIYAKVSNRQLSNIKSPLDDIM